MDFYVEYSCEDNYETGRTKLTVSEFDTTTIRDVKYAIQAAIQAPVCDQQLFYQGQPVTDDDMTLSRLYFREGDCFKVKFLAVVDIAGMTEQLDVLKKSTQYIVEKLNRRPPSKLEAEENSANGLSQRFYNQWQYHLVMAIDELSCSFFSPWKQLRATAQRHFFVQEGGFDAFLEVFKYSQRVNLVEDDINPGLDVVMQQHNLHEFCLDLLGNFAETTEEQKFILFKGVFPHVIDAVLLQPGTQTEHASYLAVIGVNEAAIGCCLGLIENDANVQEEVSKMPPLIDKLLFMTDGNRLSGYSTSANQLASITLLYCTYNVKSAKPLVDCGALEKMVNITRNFDKDSDTLLRYYCCLFLARMRSAPLIKLDKDTCAAIDELIVSFLDGLVPGELSKWEEEMPAIWMTIIPHIHLAFAAGKEYYLDENQIKDHRYGNEVHGTHQSEEACFMESEPTTNSTPEVHNAGMAIMESEPTVNSTPEVHNAGMANTESEPTINSTPEVHNAGMANVESEPTINSTPEVHNAGVADLKKSWASHRLSNSDSREEKQVSESMEITTSLMSDNNDIVTAGQKNQILWPGSASTQKLGVLSLVHTLSMEETLQTALSENILPYLVCLSWRLNFDDRVKLNTGLEKCLNVSVPSLKVAAKSVLSTVYGFDMVLNL